MFRYSTHKEKPNYVFSSLPCGRKFSDQANSFAENKPTPPMEIVQSEQTEVNRVKAGVDPVCLARKSGLAQQRKEYS